MNYRRLPALLAALFLQFAPLVRTVEPLATAVLQPLAILFRWAASAAALAGSVHALSGATGLISSSAVQGTTGSPLTYRAQIVSDAHGTPKSYSATGLPPGLNLSRSGPLAGTISGIPTTAGTFNTRVTGWENSNTSGDNFTATVRFTIAASGPEIVTDPVGGSFTAGSAVTLSVVATGSGALSYQWFRGADPIPSGTGAQLVLDPVAVSDSGSYTVRVTDGGGTATSNPAILVITPSVVPPGITFLTPGLTVHAGERIRLQVATDVVDVAPDFQWRLDGTAVPAGRGALLELPPFETPGQHQLDVIVGASGLNTTSSPVVVTVVGPLVSGLPVRGPDGIEIPFTAIPGRRYRLESSNGLLSPEWTSIDDRIPENAAGRFLVTPGSDVLRLLRLRVEDIPVPAP